MNIGLFGGTFDPIHLGHIALARAAQERCQLGRILFVPTNVSPHKQAQQSAPYFHRYTMVALATMSDKAFVPSLAEAPSAVANDRKGKGAASVTVNYSIDTVRRLRLTFKKADRLYFLIGMDAFKDIAKWHEAEALFRECEFIVASRPGYSLADVAHALPEKLRPRPEATKPFVKQPAQGDLVLPGVTIHLLPDLHQNVSATAIRDAVIAKKPLTKYLDPAVAEYIKKTGLYGKSGE